MDLDKEMAKLEEKLNKVFAEADTKNANIEKFLQENKNISAKNDARLIGKK